MSRGEGPMLDFTVFSQDVLFFSQPFQTACCSGACISTEILGNPETDLWVFLCLPHHLLHCVHGHAFKSCQITTLKLFFIIICYYFKYSLGVLIILPHVVLRENALRRTKIIHGNDFCQREGNSFRQLPE